MSTPRHFRELAFELADAARSDDHARWQAGAERLTALDGRGWLMLDDVARHWDPRTGAVPVHGSKDWLGASITEVSGFVATVTSLHADGRIRERATRVLPTLVGDLAVRGLAVRCLDHVPQVRAEAVRAVQTRTHLDTAEALLSVLLAGRGRYHGLAALDAVLVRLESSSTPREIFGELRSSAERYVRRWAHQEAQKRDLLSSTDLFKLVQHDADQRLRAHAATWLEPDATAEQLHFLFSSRFVDGRLLAINRLEDATLDDERVLSALGDSSGRVREVAQWRARRRGLDPVTAYRRWLVMGERSSAQLAASLEALGGVGRGSHDANLVRSYLTDSHVRVRAAAVRAFAALTDDSQTREHLLPMLLDPSPRVATAAAVALARSGATSRDAEQAWASAQPWSRRAAWRLARTTGSWERVVADLRAATDADSVLRGLGSAGVHNWLDRSAATTWGMPSLQQAELMESLLDTAVLGDKQRREVAFHAGLATPVQVTAAKQPPDAATDEPAARRRGVLRLLRLM